MLPAWAAPLSPGQALERLLGSDAPIKAPAMTELSLKYDDLISESSIYLFQRSNNGGYLLVSADDAAPALLGYCSEGTLPDDYGELPESFRYWLSSIADQVEYASSHHAKKGLKINGSYANRANINPLCTTKWNQSAPYNNKCPLISIGGPRCVTGCVATAMAQTLKYYNYPTKGVGSHSYRWEGKNLTFDYENTTFDWANMLDTYDDNASAQQELAVAILMRACGIGVDMMYSEKASGAYSPNIVRALVENFNYDKGAIYLDRNYFSIADWDNIVYTNLSQNGPVLYAGTSVAGGHQFVVDGYQDGYYHLNWGWGGMSDGWFLLSALDPMAQGIGGSNYGFFFNQSIIANVKTTHTTLTTPTNLLWNGNFEIADEVVNLESEYITAMGSCYNFSPFEISDFTIGLLFTPTNNPNGSVYIPGWQIDEPLPLFYGFSDAEIDIDALGELSNGTSYYVKPAYCPANSNPIAMPVAVNCVQQYTMTLNNNIATFSAVEPAEVEVDNFTLDFDLYLKGRFNCSATLINQDQNKDFYSSIVVAFMQNDDFVAIGNPTSVAIGPGESYELTYGSQINGLQNKSLQPGACKLYLMQEDTDGSYFAIAGPIDATAKEGASVNELTISINDTQSMIFDLAGRKINDSNLTPGIYIVRKTTDNKTTSHKIIIK